MFYVAGKTVCLQRVFPPHGHYTKVQARSIFSERRTRASPFYLTREKDQRTALSKVGLTQVQVKAIEQQVVAGLSNLAGSLASELAPLLGGLAGGLLNILLTAVISIYLLVDGARLVNWLRKATPSLIGKSVELNPAIMLIALTAGAELFGPFGAIFAAPTAGVLQALFTALWIQYRQTHREEFPDDGQEPPAQQPEELPA